MRKIKKACPDERIVNPARRWLTLGLASGLGTGYSPFAPGTMGSLVGLPLGIFLLHYPLWMAGLTLLIFLPVCSYIADKAGRHWGDMDAGRITIDEVYGQAIAMLGLRHFVLQHDGNLWAIPWEAVLAAFVLFRVFDIFKPFPAKTFDRQATGFSNVMDDVVAGIYAALIVRALSLIWY